MAIDKALYQAPEGYMDADPMMDDEHVLEIEIEDPESVTLGIDGM